MVNMLIFKVAYGQGHCGNVYSSSSVGIVVNVYVVVAAVCLL